MFQVRKNKTTPVPEIEALPEPEPKEQIMPTLNTPMPTNSNGTDALLAADDLRPSSASHSTNQGALLGRGARFEGKLTFEGTVEIQGEFYGEINSNGHLAVSPDARIEGTVEVASAVISGHLKGNIKTSGTLDLRTSAHVVGEIEVESLTVEKGAYFQGQVTMSPKN